jgi:hypothetical protein
MILQDNQRVNAVVRRPTPRPTLKPCACVQRLDIFGNALYNVGILFNMVKRVAHMNLVPNISPDHQ